MPVVAPPALASSGLPTLSVVIICLNEAHDIGRCIGSVQGLATEVVVLDGGSTDATQQIARGLGARVEVAADWPGFGPQKNRALALATGDWVLSLDADEWVEPALAQDIRQALAQPGAHVAFEMPRLSRFCGTIIRHSGWTPDPVLRLFKRGAARFSDDLVHERVLPQGPVGRLAHPLQHDSFKDLSEVLRKMDQYASASAQQKFAQGQRSSLLAAMLHGMWAFVRSYVLRRGFLDGQAGLLLAITNGHGTFYRHARLWLLGRSARNR
jgi:glycosyltransferase involved in cell wall biosynthesis